MTAQQGHYDASDGPRIGSLFSGYGGLEQGVQQVLGGTVAWHSEIDPGPCKVLAHRHPGVPNLGDITTVDWSAVEPVDVLVGGFPCQDVSAAGKRAGLRPGTRSGLWSQFAYAISQLRPPLVVIENVRNLLSADAHSDVEPCPWCVGDAGGELLRALGAVLGDLAALGFDAEWVGVRAADVGAPHERYRVFVLAWPAADAERDRRARRPETSATGRQNGGGPRAATPRRGGHAADAAGAGLEGRRPSGSPSEGPRPAGNRGDATAHSHGNAVREQPVPIAGCGGASVAGFPSADTAPDTSSDGRHEGRTEPARLVRGPDASLGGDAAAHSDRRGRRPDLHGIRAGQPDAHRGLAADPDRDSLLVRVEPGVGARRHADRRRSVDWGTYTAAIRRWERALGRPAPAPTEPGGSGMGRIRQFAHQHGVDGYTAREMLRAGRWGARLAPPFVEWMQGVLAGWVTDVPGVTRNEALKMLGNGVVPQQAEHAVELLLNRIGWRWAA